MTNMNERLILKEMKTLDPTAIIDTDEKEVLALIGAGMNTDLALDVALVYPVVAIRKIVESEDFDALKTVKGIGDKRAEMIIKTLKGRIPAAMSKEKVRVPDPHMHKVPNRNLIIDDDGEANLTKFKVKNGELVKDAKGEYVKDIALKRYGPILQKAVELNNGKEDRLVFTTISQVVEDYKNPEMELIAKEGWANIVNGGINVMDDEFIAAIMGTNANMKCQIHWLPKNIALAVRAWALCGGKVRSNTNLAKLEAYIGLLLPYTKELLGGILTPDMKVLIPEWNNTHKGDNMLISPDGKMEMKHEFNVAEFDGQCAVELTDEIIEELDLTKKEVYRIEKACAKFKGGTTRASLTKECIYWFPMHKVLSEMGVDSIQGKPLNKIALFGDASTFKAKIGDDGLFQKFEDYCVNFKQMKHRYGLLLENHGVKSSYTPAQQLQAAHGCDKKFIEQGGFAEVEYLKEVQDPKVAAARYLPKCVAEIAQEDAKISGIWFAQEIIKTGYQKELYQSLSGATHANSLVGFVIKDPIAFCEWIAYCEGKRTELPQGCLKKYQVLAPCGGYTGEAVASRNPVISNYGLVPVDVIEKVDSKWAWAFEGLDFVIVSIHDDICKRLRMDHDGDKMRLTTAKWFVDAVKSIKAMPFAEWESFGEAVKNMCTWEDTQEFFATRTVTPQLGRNVNFAGQLIAMGLIHGIVSDEEAEWLMDYMMNKGTDVKQGADGSSCEGAAGEIWKKLKEGLKEAFEKGKKANTKAQAYGKYIKTGTFPKSDDIESEYGDDNLSIVSRIVRENAPRKIVLPKGFCIRDVMVGKMRSIEGLTGSGTKEKNYEDIGLFNKLVSQGRDVWEQMSESDRKSGAYTDFMEFRKQSALDAFEKFAEEHGVTMSDVYDALVTYVFGVLGSAYFSKKTTEKAKRWMMVLATTFCGWFGDKMEETYCANKALGCLKAVQSKQRYIDDMFDD